MSFWNWKKERSVCTESSDYLLLILSLPMVTPQEGRSQGDNLDSFQGFPLHDSNWKPKGKDTHGCNPHSQPPTAWNGAAGWRVNLEEQAEDVLWF